VDRLLTLTTGISRKAARHLRLKPFRLRNPAPLVSFTFDDVPESAYSAGAILEELEFRGTFYIAAGTCGTDEPLWRVIDGARVRELHRHGHEIGCHTFSHVNVETLSGSAMEAECRRNAAALRELCGDVEISNFCFPFGRLTLPRKLQLQRRFDTCRGIYEGINSGTVDLGLLRVIELYDRTLTPEKIRRVIAETRLRNGWLIFYTHDVADPPSWIGCSPALFRHVAETVRSAGFECLPVRDALSRCGYQPGNAARAGSRDRVGDDALL
jgi:peptidoglycan/xylan/chitin deacetylase (PgdA/CDA1 family)